MDAVNPRDVMRMIEQEGFTLVDTRIQWYAALSLSLSANPPHTHVRWYPTRGSSTHYYWASLPGSCVHECCRTNSSRWGGAGRWTSGVWISRERCSCPCIAL